MSQRHVRYAIRHAISNDLPALAALKSPSALHRDRLRDADNEKLLYLVIEEQASGLVGFGLLVFERPPSWPDAGDRSCLPCAVDLLVQPDYRGQGLGTRLLERMANIVRARGGQELYLGVDPVENPRALALYQRLGFVPLHDAPTWEEMSFVDSDGHQHAWAEWSLDMVKAL